MITLSTLLGNLAPTSDLSDLFAAIVSVAAYALDAQGSTWAPATAYADRSSGSPSIVNSGGVPFVCYAGGTSDAGAGPSGVGSQTDTNGVGWTPLFYYGERYLKQAGAPPRIVMVELQDSGKLGPPARIGAQYVAEREELLRCYVWGSETESDALRYKEARALAAWLVNLFRRAAPGRVELKALARSTETSILTYGEEYQLTAAYSNGIGRDPWTWRVPPAVSNAQPPRPDQPFGDTGETVTVSVDAAPISTR